MVYKKDTTLGQTKEFAAQIQVLDIPTRLHVARLFLDHDRALGPAVRRRGHDLACHREFTAAAFRAALARHPLADFAVLDEGVVALHLEELLTNRLDSTNGLGPLLVLLRPASTR